MSLRLPSRRGLIKGVVLGGIGAVVLTNDHSKSGNQPALFAFSLGIAPINGERYEAFATMATMTKGPNRLPTLLIVPKKELPGGFTPYIVGITNDGMGLADPHTGEPTPGALHSFPRMIPYPEIRGAASKPIHLAVVIADTHGHTYLLPGHIRLGNATSGNTIIEGSANPHMYLQTYTQSPPMQTVPHPYAKSALPGIQTATAALTAGHYASTPLIDLSATKPTPSRPLGLGS